MCTNTFFRIHGGLYIVIHIPHSLTWIWVPHIHEGVTSHSYLHGVYFSRRYYISSDDRDSSPPRGDSWYTDIGQIRVGAAEVLLT